MGGRADTGIRLRADEDKVPDALAREHVLQVSGLEGVAEALAHLRLALGGLELG